MYALYVVLFSGATVPPVGDLGLDAQILPSEQLWLIAFAALQVMIATLVVITIRRRLETLRSNLSKSEAAVDELSSLYRNVVESMYSGLVTAGMDGMVTSVNPAAERILQTRVELGRPLKMLDAIDDAMQKATVGMSRFERVLPIQDGTEIIVGGSVSPLMDSEGVQTGFLLIFRDLTELKAMEARLRLSERLATVGELAAGLAHEVRTPLASIQGCAQILRRPDSDGEMVDRVMTILVRESERVGAVVSGFLELASPRDLTIEPIRLFDVLEEAKATWDTDPSHAELPLALDAPDDVWILGDRLASHQILTNLLSNSHKAVAGKSGPAIAIQARMQNGRLGLTVSDNGIGMSKAKIADVFVPFHSGFAEGTGIGMSLVFQFAQRMEWEIGIASEVGVGTAVTLTIPVGAAPEGNSLFTKQSS
jgi:two-component system sensor histidine kinase PilS (NtrC family)